MAADLCQGYELCGIQQDQMRDYFWHGVDSPVT